MKSVLGTTYLFEQIAITLFKTAYLVLANDLQPKNAFPLTSQNLDEKYNFHHIIIYKL